MIDALWSGLGIFCIFLSLSAIVYCLYALLKERKMIRHLLAPDEKVPHWYTNAIPRKYSEFLVNGLVSIKVQTFEATNGLVWLAAGLILVSGLYWLGLYAFREVKKHRARSSSSSSQTPD